LQLPPSAPNPRLDIPTNLLGDQGAKGLQVELEHPGDVTNQLASSPRGDDFQHTQVVHLSQRDQVQSKAASRLQLRHGLLPTVSRKRLDFLRALAPGLFLQRQFSPLPSPSRRVSRRTSAISPAIAGARARS